MSGATAESSAASARPIPMRMRADLDVRAQQHGGRRWWLIKDPVRLSYCHLLDEEYAILRMLDGRASYKEIVANFGRMFAPRSMTIDRLRVFVTRLYQDGLVVVTGRGQGEQLLKRRRQRWWSELGARASNLLAIRYRGLDPQRFLDWLYPKCRWLFAPGVLALAAVLVVAALVTAGVEAGRLRASVPEMSEFFTASTLLWMAVALSLVKVLHELGHALTLKHHGGECHELGVMLLVFTPCLYCDVSDAWTFGSRWRRMAVSGAGIAVELVLAAAAFFLWRASEPGVLNSLMLNIVLVASLGTVLLNGNPLLRYDGYYLLGDWLGVPNLQQQSRDALWQPLLRLCLGIDNANERATVGRGRPWLAAYAVCATVYRWLVVGTILWFLHRALEPSGFDWVVLLIAASVVAGASMGPLRWLRQMVRDPRRRRQLHRGRATLTCLAAGVVVLLVLVVPLPHRVVVTAMVVPKDAERVYVTVPGQLTSAVRYGATVQQGATIASLRNIDVELEIVELETRRDRQRTRLENLQRRRLADSEAGDQIGVAKTILTAVETQLTELIKDAERLQLGATRAGMILPPPARSGGATHEMELQGWTGHPLDEVNEGALLETGTLVCLVGDVRQLKATLLVEQSDIEFVHVGDSVQLQLDQLKGRVISGVVESIARTDTTLVSPQLVASGQTATRQDDTGELRPTVTSYQATVTLSDFDSPAVVRGSGRARVLAQPRSLGQRIGRYLARTFRWDW